MHQFHETLVISPGQRSRRNSTLEDRSRVKYIHAYIGSVLDAVRYSNLLPCQNFFFFLVIRVTLYDLTLLLLLLLCL